MAFKIDAAEEKDNTLTISQLKMRCVYQLKKDKLCVVPNKVLVLLTKEDQKDITGLIARVKSNLYAEDNLVQSKLLSLVSVYSLRVDESVNNSEDLLKELRSDEIKEQNKYRFS